MDKIKLELIDIRNIRKKYLNDGYELNTPHIIAQSNSACVQCDNEVVNLHATRGTVAGTEPHLCERQCEPYVEGGRNSGCGSPPPAARRQVLRGRQMALYCPSGKLL